MTQESRETRTPHVQIKRILVSTDFSPLADYAVKVAGEFARRYKAHLTVVHVMAPYFGGTEADVLAVPSAYYGRDLMTMLEERLEEVAAGLRKEAIEVDTLLPMGVPFVEIVKAARNLDVDLIIIATHGRGGLTHALLGSTAERVVRKAPCPVLSIRPKDEEEEK
jgi:nucleotide-binding universal stress UspA family protein